MWLFQKHHPVVRTDAEWPLYAGALLVAAGFAVDLLSILRFRSEETTVNPLKPENTTSLLTSGIYSVTRNPMYLGMAIMLVGAALLMRCLSPLVMPLVFCLVVTVMQILPEERALEKLFGEEYTAYKAALDLTALVCVPVYSALVPHITPGLTKRITEADYHGSFGIPVLLRDN